MRFISAEQIATELTWQYVIHGMREGHLGPRPLGDSYFIGDQNFGLFSRGVILPGKGAGFKIVSIYPQNTQAEPPLPTEHGAFVVLDEQTKQPIAVLDSPEITRWKTAGDSALAASILSREDSKTLLVLGAGPVAKALVYAYLQIRPTITEILLWNRTASKLEAIFAELSERSDLKVEIVKDLDEAVSRADIISSATSSNTPNIRGAYVKPGTHVDLVGGYRLDMQEADVAVFDGARVFVDDQENALASGDLALPIKANVMSVADIEGDLFELCQLDHFERSREDITVYKNAGGAHLDLMVCQLVVKQLQHKP